MVQAPAYLLIAFGLAAQTPAGTSSYHDPGLRFTYTYPGDFTTAPFTQKEFNALAAGGVSAAARPALDCSTTPVLASRNVNAHQAEFLMVPRIDFGCMGRLATVDMLPAMASNALRQGLGNIGDPVLSKPLVYALDKHDAVFVQASVDDPRDGIPGHAGTACTLLTNTVVCWMALTAYPSRLQALFAGTIAFADRPAVAVVPADLVLRPPGKDPESRTP